MDWYTINECSSQWYIFNNAQPMVYKEKHNVIGTADDCKIKTVIIAKNLANTCSRLGQ